jgi:hypothetical protein
MKSGGSVRRSSEKTNYRPTIGSASQALTRVDLAEAGQEASKSEAHTKGRGELIESLRASERSVHRAG